MAMRGRDLIVVVFLVVVGLALSAMVACTSESTSCAGKVAVAEDEVRTTPWESPEELPGLGQHAEIHWQLRALGDPCSRAPGPTEWEYQGVVRLEPGDVRTLAAGYDWQPVTADPPDNPVEVWPALAGFVPPDVRWLRSDAYDEAPPQVRWRRVYLDPDRSLALFVLNDH